MPKSFYFLFGGVVNKLSEHIQSKSGKVDELFPLHPKIDFFCPLLLKRVCCLLSIRHGGEKVLWMCIYAFWRRARGAASQRTQAIQAPTEEGSQAADRLGTIFSLLAELVSVSRS